MCGLNKPNTNFCLSSALHFGLFGCFYNFLSQPALCFVLQLYGGWNSSTDNFKHQTCCAFLAHMKTHTHTHTHTHKHTHTCSAVFWHLSVAKQYVDQRGENENGERSLENCTGVSWGVHTQGYMECSSLFTAWATKGSVHTLHFPAQWEEL